jgi:hypothetical protein
MTRDMNAAGWEMLARWGTYNMMNNPKYKQIRDTALARCCVHVLNDHSDIPAVSEPHTMMRDILLLLGETHGIECPLSASAALRACADMMLLREISDQEILEDLKKEMIDLPISLDN